MPESIVRSGIRLIASALIFTAACGGATTTAPSNSPPQPVPTTQPVRVLMLTATAGFRHDSIPTARQVMAALASRSGAFTVAATEELGDISAARLAATDVLMFALTSGELALDQNQKAAIVAWINNGGGFVGVHSATDTLYDWPDYGRIVGAYFKEHPWTEPATVMVEDRSHPTTSSLGANLRLLEEFYTFRENPRLSVHVLLSLDAASVGARGDFPLAWWQTIGRGRSYYNALGHFSETWNDPTFQTQMSAAVQWAGGRLQ
jgi:type 1 glutamine amidotransferase